MGGIYDGSIAACRVAFRSLVPVSLRRRESDSPMTRKPNPVASGNGAISMLSHAGRLGRALPE